MQCNAPGKKALSTCRFGHVSKNIVIYFDYFFDHFLSLSTARQCLNDLILRRDLYFSAIKDRIPE